MACTRTHSCRLFVTRKVKADPCLAQVLGGTQRENPKRSHESRVKFRPVKHICLNADPKGQYKSSWWGIKTTYRHTTTASMKAPVTSRTGAQEPDALQKPRTSSASAMAGIAAYAVIYAVLYFALSFTAADGICTIVPL